MIELLGGDWIEPVVTVLAVTAAYAVRMITPPAEAGAYSWCEVDVMDGCTAAQMSEAVSKVPAGYTADGSDCGMPGVLTLYFAQSA